MIRLQGVGYRYPEAEGPALRAVSLHVEEGEFVLVTGASGAGKSTLLRTLNGLVPHFSGGEIWGEVQVAGHDPVAEGPRAMSRIVGFVQQDPEAQFVVDTVEDELAFALGNHGFPPAVMRKRVEEVLDQLGIAHLRHRRVSTLSGGEKQRVAIGSVLTLQPRILVLDEPTSQLDPQAAEEVLTSLRHLNLDLGLTVLVSEHRLERVVQYADKVVYLPRAGEPPVVGTPEEVLRQMPYRPPLVELGMALGWYPLPLTLKEARRWARDLPLHPPDGSEARERPSGPPVLWAEDVWYAYNGTPALRGMQLTAWKGQVVALVGRNGSGKTTFFKCLVGLLRPARGRLQVVGLDAGQVPLEAIVAHVGYVPQDPGALLFAESVVEELAFTRQARGLPPRDPSPLLNLLGLEGKGARYPRDLSVGERQRVALGAVLAGDPEVLLLDEPTRGMDLEQKATLARFLQEWVEGGRTALIATHDVEWVARCADRVVLMGEGQAVAEGPPREVMGASLAFATQMAKLFGDPRLLTVEDVLRAVEGARP